MPALSLNGLFRHVRTTLVLSTALGLLACSSGRGGSDAGEEASTSTAEDAADDSDGAGAESESESTGGEDPCDATDCIMDVAAGLQACAESCGCADFDCLAKCYPESTTPFAACIEGQPAECEMPSRIPGGRECSDQCTAQTEVCLAGDCDPNACEYEDAMCNSICSSCQAPAELNHAYDGSCSVEVVAAPLHEGGEYLEIGDLYVEFSEEGVCEGEVGANWTDATKVAFELCPEPCAAFEELGELVVTYGANQTCD